MLGVIGFPDMRQKVKGIMAHPLFSGSAIMVFGSNFANFFAYLYHVVIGRLLGPSLYGELAATLSLIGMISASFSFFSLVIVKFVSSAGNWALQSEPSGKEYVEDSVGVIEKIQHPFFKSRKILLVAGKRNAGTISAILALAKYSL